MAQRLRAAVAGAGVFGGYHAKKYAQLPDVDLVGVYDHNLDRACALAEGLGAKGVSEDGLEALLDHIDVLTIALPALAHETLAIKAIAKGVHVYVEKPIAQDRASAERILDAAEAKGVVLAVGHQERAVFEALGLFDIGEAPQVIEAVRKGTFTGRNGDVSVILDLMIHDLDLVLALAESDVAEIKLDHQTLHGPHMDVAKAQLRFENGLVAEFVSDRAAEARERTMRVVYPSGEVRIDFLARTFENTTPYRLDPNFADTEIGKDPLGASVKAFLACVRGEAQMPLVSGEDALEALDLALRIEGAGSVPVSAEG